MDKKTAKKSPPRRRPSSAMQAHHANVMGLVKRTRLFLMGDEEDTFNSLIDDILDAILRRRRLQDEITLKR